MLLYYLIINLLISRLPHLLESQNDALLDVHIVFASLQQECDVATLRQRAHQVEYLAECPSPPIPTSLHSLLCRISGRVKREGWQLKVYCIIQTSTTLFSAVNATCQVGCTDLIHFSAR